jgi:hypothetical protein
MTDFILKPLSPQRETTGGPWWTSMDVKEKRSLSLPWIKPQLSSPQ